MMVVKGVVRHLGLGRRNPVDHRGLSGVRQAHQADVGQQFQFQPDGHFDGRSRRGREVRRLAPWKGEVLVALAGVAPLADDVLLAGRHEVAQYHAVLVEDEGAHGDLQDQVQPAAAAHAAALAGRPVLGGVLAFEVVVQQGVQAQFGLEHHVAAPAAVAAVGPALRDELLPTEGHAAFAAAARANQDHGFVDEPHGRLG
jgi:hypothetical protein